MAPHFIILPCALALPFPIHRDTATPSPCWAPHFMTQERLVFSNLTPSEPYLSPTVTMSDYMLSALTLPLPCASILQSVTAPQVDSFECWNIFAPICLNCFTLAESRKPDLWTCVCVLPFVLLSLLSDRNELQLEVPVCNLVVIITAMPLLLYS